MRTARSPLAPWGCTSKKWNAAERACDCGRMAAAERACDCGRMAAADDCGRVWVAGTLLLTPV